MSHFASRDLSFVSLAELGVEKTTGNTQTCAKEKGAKACTCCTDGTNKKRALVDDSDLASLEQQLVDACS